MLIVNAYKLPKSSEEEKEIEAQCQFCGKKYKFTEKDFEDILKK